MYAADYDGRLPPLRKNGNLRVRYEDHWKEDYTYGWVDTLSIHSRVPYALFVCRSDYRKSANLGFDPRTAGFTSYWMNANMALQRVTSTSAPERTILVGEGDVRSEASDASYALGRILPDWISDSTSPLSRHGGGANYVLLDGSVHWWKPQQLAHILGRTDILSLMPKTVGLTVGKRASSRRHPQQKPKNTGRH